jgi:formylglycine-generating enzyme required for sulfatase activity
VTYKDAAAFAAWAGKRLLSGQEWDNAGGKRTAVFEWTATPYTPAAADLEAFRKLAGTEPRGGWFVVKGGAPLPGMPSESRPGDIAVGFRCVKEVAR